MKNDQRKFRVYFTTFRRYHRWPLEDQVRLIPGRMQVSSETGVGAWEEAAKVLHTADCGRFQHERGLLESSHIDRIQDDQGNWIPFQPRLPVL
jgi:hypothetical protein